MKRKRIESLREGVLWLATAGMVLWMLAIHLQHYYHVMGRARSAARAHEPMINSTVNNQPTGGGK